MEKRCLVGGCIAIKDGKVLMIKHKKLGVWLYPGGHMDEGEFPHDCALREMEEETGLKAELIDTRKIEFSEKETYKVPSPFAVVVEKVNYKDGAHIHYDMIYLAKPGSGDLKQNAAETDSIGWFSAKELDSLETFDNVRKVAQAALKHAEENF
jgi:8-oxo-dGTP diphosphatase